MVALRPPVFGYSKHDYSRILVRQLRGRGRAFPHSRSTRRHATALRKRPFGAARRMRISFAMDTIVQALRDALGDFVAFLPALVAGSIVLLIGWIVAAVVRRLINALLPRTGFDRFLARHRVTTRVPETHTGSRIVASAAFWAVMLIALMQAANVWGLEFVANGLARAIAYVPNIVAAALIFGLALFLGNWVRERMRERSEVSGTAFLPDATRAGILTVGAFFALRQLQIAPDLLLIGFALVLGAVAVATAIAFGLGGRDTVHRMTQDWYERRRERRAGGTAEESTSVRGYPPGGVVEPRP